MKLNFESAIEKIGRVIARQYNIDVVFEGNQAMTDGKKVYLPYFENMTEEFKLDINGYLDHEIGHCRYTTFPEIGKVINRFHKELLNACEDVRIENEMMKDFPGTALHLVPLNEKWRQKALDSWENFPWPIRTQLAVRDIMDYREPIVGEDIKDYIEKVEDLAISLRDATDTQTVREITEKIVKIIQKESEEKRKEESEDADSDESGMGEEKSDSEGKGKESEGEGSETGEGEGEGEGENKGESGETDSEGKGRGSKKGEGTRTKRPKTEEEKMLTEKDGEADSEFDKHVTDVHDYINDEIESEVKEGEKISRASEYRDGWSSKPHIPVTTRFDKVTDHSGKGGYKKYMELRKEVQKYIGNTKRSLEKMLIVKENARWKQEQERGVINTRSFTKMLTTPNYRTPFKKFTKTDTRNVAVEILVDMSGSMSGRMDTAKKAVIVMSEALRDLDISFEVTGFHSVSDNRVYDTTRGLDTERFNRTDERLDLHVFKSFEKNNLTGIEKLFVGVQNPDGECVKWAAKRLAQRKEARKILIVLSDGSPATGDGDYAILNNDLKKSVKGILKSGIECVGIGIQTESVKNFYPDNIVIDRINELPTKAMNKLSKILLKGF